MNLLMTGATGFLGTQLSGRLTENGHRVFPISRRSGVGHGWSEDQLRAALTHADAIVHLAGENIFSRRWNTKQKEELRRSRIDTTAILASLAPEFGIRHFIGASAVGYYGPSDDRELNESSPAGSDFLARLCADWEAAAQPARDAGIPVTHIRIGVILGRNGGALKKMLPPFKMGLGGPLGSGSQYFSWIHIEDLVQLFLFVLGKPEARGAFNGTAPEPVTNKEFTKTLGKVLSRPTILPAPAFGVKLALGEVADVLLTGQRAVPRRALDEGFHFSYPDLEGALRNILGKKG